MNVFIETLEFSECVKNNILKIEDITKLDIEYVWGKNIIFKNTNLTLIGPHKIIISNNTKGIFLLCYNGDTTLYKNGLLSTFTINVQKYGKIILIGDD